MGDCDGEEREGEKEEEGRFESFGEKMKEK